ncbi:MAG: glycine cleavage system aminomethyltransferase GcvT [Kiritimatiellae bacterium]|nr:glycine cleavage system aminomethyltransferase GcvT [Kiritimatiellia bacterium]
MQQTILHDRHVALGARMVPFAGWDMPVQYEGVLAEHQRTRQAVALFDTCHMDAFRVRGRGTLDYLSRMLTDDLRTLADGRCPYGFLLRDDGGVLDDLIAYRVTAEDWMLVVNAGTAEGDFAWLRQHLEGNAGVTLEDLRGAQGKLDVQGPESQAAVEGLLRQDLGALKRFSFGAWRYDGAALTVSRTGYTGENGYELYAPVAAIPRLWDRLIELGATPAGLGARDTLRLEAGLPLYGHELSVDVTPVEAGMMRYAGKNEPFTGREALLARMTAGVAWQLTPFVIAGRQTARNGNRVQAADGTDIGWVTSGSFAPSLGYAIGFAYVKPAHAGAGCCWRVDVGRRLLEARVTAAPFYRR